jgi:L-lactate utilization protein LutB
MAEKEELTWEEHLAKAIRGFRTEVKSALEPLMPPEEFRTHCRAARKEMLLAFRSLIDAAIEELEKKPVPKKTTKIQVQ